MKVNHANKLVSLNESEFPCEFTVRSGWRTVILSPNGFVKRKPSRGLVPVAAIPEINGRNVHSRKKKEKA